jgi:uncharacterized protein (DUF169 family)
MDKEQLQQNLDKAHCALGLKRKIVGVKFLFDKEEYEEYDAKQIATQIPYCVMVKRAMSGNKIKAVFEDFGCLGAARNLGLYQADHAFLSGRHYRKLGLYKDLVIAKDAVQNMSRCTHDAYAIVIMPLEDFCTEPDVVIMVTNPYQGMRVAQGYTYNYGINPSFKLSGNSALCSECTAYPFENNTINISLLCSGTRYMAGWGEDEIAIGLSYNKFASVIDGVYKTVNKTEPDVKKKLIDLRLKESGREDFDIEYGKNYYTGLYTNEKKTEKHSPAK